MCLWCAPGGARPAGAGAPEGSVWTAVGAGARAVPVCGVRMGRALRGPAPSPATNMIKLLWLVSSWFRTRPVYRP